ncbi:MAG: ABC transporter permease [Treponema sp.]|nr:ABC transporter permease [Treponema sp.]
MKQAAWGCARERRRILLLRFFKRRLVVAGCLITLLMVILAVLAPLIAPYDIYAIDVAGKLRPPDGEHIFGTDHLGRDIFSRVLFATGISLRVGISSALVTFVCGLLLGLLAGYVRFLDNPIMRVCESLMAIPPILMAIALVAVIGPSVGNVTAALSVVYTPAVARIARASTLAIRETNYIEAVHALGAGKARVILRHILPNAISPVIVQATHICAAAITIEASLSFLGVGVPEPAPSLGSMLFEAKSYIYNSWWMTLYPALFTILNVLGINLFGDGLRDVLDPLSN